METRYLKYFIDVADTLSFTKAAQMNHVVQTTMSQSILTLENQLGFKLFERNNRSVRLTKLGELFYNDAEYILHAVNQTNHHISQIKNGSEGFLNIGYTGEHSLRFMPGIIKEFRKRFPQIGINLMQAYPSKLTSLLEEGECDVVFTLAKEKDLNDYEEVICESQELYLVIPVDHPFAEREEISYADIQEEPMIFFHPSCGNSMYNDMIYHSVKGGYSPNIVGYASDPRSLIIMVELGMGITILPKSCDMGHNGGVKFIKLQDSQKLDISARWLVSDSNPSLQNFLTVLLERYPRQL